MDTVEIQAELVTEDESYFIQIADNPPIRIPISEDNALLSVLQCGGQWQEWRVFEHADYTLAILFR